MIEVINGIVIRGGKILLGEKKGTLILLGGKKEEGESDKECLKREIREETGVDIKIGRFFCEVIGISPNSKRKIRAKAYFATLKGEPKIQEGDSIKKLKWVKWVKRKEIDKIPISDISKEIILKIKGNKF